MNAIDYNIASQDYHDSTYSFEVRYVDRRTGHEMTLPVEATGDLDAQLIALREMRFRGLRGWTWMSTRAARVEAIPTIPGSRFLFCKGGCGSAPSTTTRRGYCLMCFEGIREFWTCQAPKCTALLSRPWKQIDGNSDLNTIGRCAIHAAKTNGRRTNRVFSKRAM